MTALPYQKSGEGPPLLLLHGWPFHAASYRKLLPFIEPYFTCYAVESAGLSDQGDFESMDMSFGGHAKRVIELVQQLGLQTVSIIGHDTGATIARLAAAELGDRVERLYLLNTEMPNHRPPFIPLFQKTIGLPAARASFGFALRRDAFVYSPMGFGGCVFDKKHIDTEFRQLFVEHWFESSRRFNGLAAYLRGLDFSDLETLDKVHREIKAPIHFIWGRDDVTFPCDLALAMAKRIPQGARFDVVDDACFLLHEERPEEVAKHMLAVI